MPTATATPPPAAAASEARPARRRNPGAATSPPPAASVRLLRALCTGLLALAAAAAGAQVSHVVSLPATTPSNNVSSVQTAVPAGVVAGDLMLAWIAQRGSAFPVVSTAPAGWTLVLARDDGGSIGAALYRRVATASEPASYTWTLRNDDRAAAAIAVFRGIDTSAPVEASGAQANAASTSLTAPSLTTTSADTMLVAWYAAAHGTLTSTPPAGMTEAFDAGNGAGPNGAGVAASYATLAAAGASGSRVATASISAASIGAAVALKRAAVVAPTVDHYELAAPSSGVACLASTLTVTACADASSPCTNRATGMSGHSATLSTSAGTLGATTLNFDANGVATTTLSHPSANDGAAVTLTLAGESVAAANPRRCCPDGASCSVANSCTTSFSTAGFVVAASAGGAATTLPTMTAGASSGSYVLRAVRTGTTSKACEAALTGTANVDWSYTCNDPTTCSAGSRLTLTGTAATPVAGNPDGSSASRTAVAMNFDADGNAPFGFAYADVGRITLDVSKAAGGALLAPLAGRSNAFVVRPAGFTLSSIRCTDYAAGSCATSAIASPGANPGASTVSGTAFVPAGRPFSATVTAVDAAGQPTPNYGRETAAEGVRLAAALLAPAGGHNPALGNASGFGPFTNGAATGTAFSWSEVGAITLTPSVADGSYLGTGEVVGTPSGPVGRFFADHLTTTVTPACAASFSYAGQPFAATVTARNAAGSALQNYGAAGFAKAVTLSEGAALGVGALGGAAVAAAAFAAGIAGAAPAYEFANKLTGPRTLVLRATDADGANSAGRIEGSTGLRSGRLRVANGFGRENTPLALAVQAEYWTGASWLLNDADQCTAVPAAAVALGNHRDAKGAATTAWTTSASAIAVAGGRGTLILAAPGGGAAGTVDLALNLGSAGAPMSCVAGLPASAGAGVPWLRAQNGACAATHDRDPAARASFGIFAPETRRTVHAREIF